IEAFIDWKVREEQKVAAMVAGSRTVRKHLRAILDATTGADAAPASLDLADNQRLRKAVARARRDGVPEGYIQRVFQLVTQHEAPEDFREFDTDWQGEAYVTVS